MSDNAPKTVDALCDLLSARGIIYTRYGNDITVKGSLYLSSLTTLPEGVRLSAGCSLNLRSLTTLPEGVTLSAGYWLYLGSVTTLPERATLSARDFLDLRSLTDECQTYQGQRIRLRTIDGICTRLIRRRAVGDMTLWTAQYFKGHLDSDKRCYVAQLGYTYAHGDTSHEAIRDLRFKFAQIDFDASDLVTTIKERGTVTFNDYRLLTGACSSGLSEGLRALGMEGAQEIQLADALRLCDGQYGGAQFRKLMGID